MMKFYSTVFSTIKTYGQGQSLMIGECQISADGNPADPVAEASLGTFEAGLWLADFLGVSSAQPNLVSVQPWGICETNWKCTFIDYTAGDKPKPVYYIYEMFSDHALSNMILCRKITGDLRIYAYSDSAGDVSIFCVNWSKIVYYSAGIDFNGGLQQNSITYIFGPLSLTCLSIPSNQASRTAYTYSSSGAAAGLGIETNGF